MSDGAKIFPLSPPKKEEKEQTYTKTTTMKWFGDVKAEPMEWYIKPWLPVKGLTGLAGPPDVGKSTYFVHEISQLTKGELGREPINVLYLTGEDNLSMNKLRLARAGADMKRVGFITVVQRLDDLEIESKLSLQDDLEELREAVREFQIKAVYLDPATTYLGIDEDKSSYSQIRSALERLNTFAEEEDILVRAMKHTKKAQAGSNGLPVVSQVYGSTAWTEVIRIFPILWAVDDKLREKLDLEDDEANRLLLRGKNNYAPHNQPARAFKILSGTVTVDDVEDEVTYLQDLGTRKVTNEDLTTKANETAKETVERKKREGAKVEHWVECLPDKLGKKEIPVKEVRELCEKDADAPSWSQVQRVQKKLSSIMVKPIPHGKHNEKMWVFDGLVSL